MEMLFFGARILTIGWTAGVKALVDSFLIVMISSVCFSSILTPITEHKQTFIAIVIKLTDTRQADNEDNGTYYVFSVVRLGSF